MNEFQPILLLGQAEPKYAVTGVGRTPDGEFIYVSRAGGKSYRFAKIKMVGRGTCQATRQTLNPGDTVFMRVGMEAIYYIGIGCVPPFVLKELETTAAVPREPLLVTREGRQIYSKELPPEEDSEVVAEIFAGTSSLFKLLYVGYKPPAWWRRTHGYTACVERIGGDFAFSKHYFPTPTGAVISALSNLV